MKKILSLLAAGALALGLTGCSDALHDMGDAPIVKQVKYIVGAMNYNEDNVFSEMVQNADGVTSTYQFVYKASMSKLWDSPSDGVAFKVCYEENGWDNAWSQAKAESTKLSDGKGEVTCTKKNAENISFAGLTEGKTYTVTVVSGVGSVSVKMEQTADIPSFALLVDNKAYEMTYTAAGEKGVYTKQITPTSDSVKLSFYNELTDETYGTSSGATAAADTAESAPVVITAKGSNTVEFTGIKSNGTGYYDYLVKLTIEGDVSTVTLTRIIPKHDVTLNFVVSGDISEGDTVFLHGWSGLGNFGGDWPVKDGAFNAWGDQLHGVVGSSKKVTLKGTISLEDNQTIASETCFCVGVFDKNGKFLWQTGDCELISYTTGTENKDVYFSLVLAKPAAGAEKGTGTCSDYTAASVTIKNVIVNADFVSNGFTLIGALNEWSGDIEGTFTDGKTTFVLPAGKTNKNIGEFKFRKDKGWAVSIGQNGGNIKDFPIATKEGTVNMVIEYSGDFSDNSSIGGISFEYVE